MRQMFTEPKIVTSKSLNKRSYVTFYIDNIRIREYNGKNIGQAITPNRSSTLAERNSLLRKLQFELHKALEAGEYPLLSEGRVNENGLQTEASYISKFKENEASLNAKSVLDKALEQKMASTLSKKYKRNLTDVHRQLTSYLVAEELEGSLLGIPTIRLDNFLSKFNSSGTYYMNKRRDLGVLFNAAGRILQQEIGLVKSTERRKVKARLHKPYEKDQLKPILNYLKDRYSNLHICCLLTFSTWLRPHEEIRLLTVGDFTNDLSEIRLSGDENKGGRVRTVYVPDYVREELEVRFMGLDRQDNIFSCSLEPYNVYYFNLQWTRARKALSQLKLVYQNQTIYSFRHTAAIQLYRRTKDVYLLQKLLGHSSINVTLKYLRSLGELNSEDLRNAAPIIE